MLREKMDLQNLSFAARSKGIRLRSGKRKTGPVPVLPSDKCAKIAESIWNLYSAPIVNAALTDSAQRSSGFELFSDENAPRIEEKLLVAKATLREAAGSYFVDICRSYTLPEDLYVQFIGVVGCQNIDYVVGRNDIKDHDVCERFTSCKGKSVINFVNVDVPDGKEIPKKVQRVTKRLVEIGDVLAEYTKGQLQVINMAPTDLKIIVKGSLPQEGKSRYIKKYEQQIIVL